MNFIKTVSFISAVCLIGSGLSAKSEAESPQISAASAIVIDGLSGTVLFEHNADCTLPMASTTKIMTAIIAIESGDLQREITATKEMVTVEGTSMGLLEGDRVTLEGLCYGMLLSSGNDAANAAAIAVAGSIPEFSELMNKKAREIGMENSGFITPSGLDSEGHFSTARDMAKLAAYAMNNKTFRKIASSESAKICYGNPPYTRTLKNHNRLLGMYDGANGVKTGFTKKSGRCLISSAERDGGRIICVTLKDPNDWDDHAALLDFGFSKLAPFTLSPPEHMSVPVTGGDVRFVSLYAQSATVSIAPEAIDSIHVSLLTQP